MAMKSSLDSRPQHFPPQQTYGGSAASQVGGGGRCVSPGSFYRLLSPFTVQRFMGLKSLHHMCLIQIIMAGEVGTR